MKPNPSRVSDTSKPIGITQPSRLRLALPSDGDLYEPSLAFLAACGIPVERPSVRRYTASVPALPGATVLFQRAADIALKVGEGSAEMGITGLDRFMEYGRDGSPVTLVMDALGFGHCELTLAVPDSWVDVDSIDDLADLAMEFHQKGKQLRIATKYPRLLKEYLYGKGIYYPSLVQASGTLEAAPTAGYADLIADITASGVTLRENQLKTIESGTILVSQACLVANLEMLRGNPKSLELAREMLDKMEGYLRARPIYRLTANIRGSSPDKVSAAILSRPDLAGLQGPTVSRVYNSAGEDWYAVSLLAHRDLLLEAVENLRNAGGIDISASQITYLFKESCHAYQRLLEAL